MRRVLEPADIPASPSWVEFRATPHRSKPEYQYKLCGNDDCTFHGRFPAFFMSYPHGPNPNGTYVRYTIIWSNTAVSYGTGTP